MPWLRAEPLGTFTMPSCWVRLAMAARRAARRCKGIELLGTLTGTS